MAGRAANKSKHENAADQRQSAIWNIEEYQNREAGMQLQRRESLLTAEASQREEDSNPPEQNNHTEVLLGANISGIWDPYRTSDITVHLHMPLREDLDETLEEFCRLQRLGNFTSAIQFFDKHLRQHIDKPYVLIEYAELLLEQGDYNTLSQITSDTEFSTGDNIGDDLDKSLLVHYWGLIREVATYHKPSAELGSFDFLIQGLRVLRVSISRALESKPGEKGDISSTEIRMLALYHYFGNLLENPLIRQTLSDLFPPIFYRNLYVNLLRAGRIWDFRDIIVIRTRIKGFDISVDWSDNPNYRLRVQSLITDWSRATKGNDISTTLALLDILMSHSLHEMTLNNEGIDNDIGDVLDKATALVSAIIEKDPDSMKCRPFIRWLLVKSLFVHRKSPSYMDSQLRALESSPGVVFNLYGGRLPLYVPSGTEKNPGWIPNQSAPDLEKTVRTVTRTSMALGDYKTAVIALKECVILSADRVETFDELSNLQTLIQGDIKNYSKETLISKYLVCNTEDLQKNLKKEILGLLDTPEISSDLSNISYWSLRMLQYALEDKGPAAKEALEAADEAYKSLPKWTQSMVDEKMPSVKERSYRYGRKLRKSEAELQDELDQLDLERRIIDAKERMLQAEWINDHESSDYSSEDSQVPPRSHMLDGKVVTISFEDTQVPPNEQNVKYQLDPRRKGWVLQGRGPLNRYAIMPPTKGNSMKTTRTRSTPFYHRHLTQSTSLTGLEDLVTAEFDEAKRILNLLKAKLTKAIEDGSPDVLGCLQVAIKDLKKEIQRLEEDVKIVQRRGPLAEESQNINFPAGKRYDSEDSDLDDDSTSYDDVDDPVGTKETEISSTETTAKMIEDVKENMGETSSQALVPYVKE